MKKMEKWMKIRDIKEKEKILQRKKINLRDFFKFKGFHGIFLAFSANVLEDLKQGL